MKLPLWAWDARDEKYVVVPLNLLRQFEDGRWGLHWPVLMGNRVHEYQHETKTFFENYYRLFECQMKDGKYWRYVLKERQHDTSVDQE